MIRHMYEPVLLSNSVENALLCFEFGFEYWCPLRIFQVGPSAVGECHEVLVVLVSASAHDGVESVDIESRHDALQQFLWHTVVVYHSDGLTALAALHSLCHLLHHTAVEVVVHLHLGILRKLE